MEENKTTINTYSLKQLQNNFIALWKNPQKYVEFELNAENTTYSDADGLYKLLPYYQKINPLGENVNYAIQWCAFTKQWQLIKVNPLGGLPRLDVEQTTIASLLEGDQFSRPIHADIKAQTSYEQIKFVVKVMGEKYKELKRKVIEMEKEIVCVQTENKNLKAFRIDKITFMQKQNENLEEQLTKMKEKNKKLKTYALGQTNIAEREKEWNTIKAEECQKFLEEIEILESNLKEKEIQIERKIIEMKSSEKQSGELAYKLHEANEFKQKCMSLEKDVKPLKIEIKTYKTEIKKLKEDANQMEIIHNKQIAEIYALNEKLMKSRYEEIDKDRLATKQREKQEKVDLYAQNEKLTKSKHEKEEIKAIKDRLETEKLEKEKQIKQWEKLQQEFFTKYFAEVQALKEKGNNDAEKIKKFEKHKSETEETIKQYGNIKKDLEELEKRVQSGTSKKIERQQKLLDKADNYINVQNKLIIYGLKLILTLSIILIFFLLKRFTLD